MPKLSPDFVDAVTARFKVQAETSIAAALQEEVKFSSPANEQDNSALVHSISESKKQQRRSAKARQKLENELAAQKNALQTALENSNIVAETLPPTSEPVPLKVNFSLEELDAHKVEVFAIAALHRNGTHSIHTGDTFAPEEKEMPSLASRVANTVNFMTMTQAFKGATAVLLVTSSKIDLSGISGLPKKYTYCLIDDDHELIPVEPEYLDMRLEA